MNAKWHWHIKTAWRKVVVLASVALVFPVFADDWLYDPSAGTISDNVWTFNATVTDNKMTVGTCTDYPAEISLLDFSKPVKDADYNEYTIKALNTAMVTFSVTGGKPESSTDK